MSEQVFNSPEYNKLKESAIGQMLIEQAKSDAAGFMFDCRSGEKNSEVASKLSACAIYDAVVYANSLSIEVDGSCYDLEPYYSGLSEDTTLEMLCDAQATIEASLLEATLKLEKAKTEEAKYSASKMDIIDVCMLDLVEDYSVPEEVPEWTWVENAASYRHQRNGEDGIWEFIINLSRDFDDIPEKLKPVIEEAKQAGAHYLLFNQGT